MRVNLKGIHEVKRRLSDGSTQSYFYAWRGGPRIKEKPGTPAFQVAYADAIKKRTIPQEGLMFSLIAGFKASSHFTALRPATRKAYLRYIKLVENEFGDMPIAAIEQRGARGVFLEWRDTMAATPRKADYAWVTLARILSVAKNRELISVNPCEDGGRLYVADRADKVWGEAEIAKLLTVASPEIELALVLALWTGQRQGDLLTLTWSAYDGRTIKLRQSKTGRRVTIPVGEPLRLLLDAVKRESTRIFINTRKKPWTSDGFRMTWSKTVERAKVEGLTFHDLRGSAVVRLALAGTSVPEIVAFTGLSLKDVESILDAHYLGRDVRLAESAVKKLERNEKRARTVKRSVKSST